MVRMIQPSITSGDRTREGKGFSAGELKAAKEAGLRVEKPRQAGKPVTGRVYRGKTGAGKKMRNLSHRK
jgi:ribosomal protein L13E